MTSLRLGDIIRGTPQFFMFTQAYFCIYKSI